MIATTTLALGCEGTKFGLFFDTKPCTDDMWQYTNMNGEDINEKAATCLLSRGTYMSCVSLVLYFLMIIYQLLVRSFPAYQHEEAQGLDYDDVTLPSFLGSIGKSVVSATSKVSKTGSAMGTSVVSGFSGFSGFSGIGASRHQSIGYNSAGPASQVMEPIMENDNDEEDEYNSSKRSLTSRGSRNSGVSKDTDYSPAIY